MIDTVNFTTYAGSLPFIKISATILALYVLWKIIFPNTTKLPTGLPIVGAKAGDWFPFWQATWRNSLNIHDTILEAYKNYGNEAAILPVAGPGGQTFVLLPASETKHVTEQPDSVLNLRDVIVQGLMYEYTLSNKYLITNPAHKKLITSTLTNQVGNLLPALADETKHAFAQGWGLDTESFRDVTIWDSMGDIVTSATNRALVGLPFCRDEAFLNAGLGFARAVPLSQLFLSFVWKPLRPVLAPLLTLPCRFYEGRFTAVLRSEIEERLRHAANSIEASTNDTTEANCKNDFLQWCIAQALESHDPPMRQTATLAGRILLTNLVSIHTSSLTITNLMLDLVSSPPEIVEEIRSEIETVLKDCGGNWTKLAFAKMEKLDSVFRESARLSTLVAIGLRRRVVAKEGFTTSTGVHIPCGAFCAVHNLGVVHDPMVYTDADTFKPFRFVGMRRNIQSDNRNHDHVQRARLTFTATTNDYLAFGNGRQSCPGRFFAAAELKLMVAYALMYYDLEHLDSRPKDRWIGILRVPSATASIRVRRRKSSIGDEIHSNKTV
ncbi:hypothetical protein NLG97_g987 [Lecanicillium saksenae]|uniref:Uncharacterized protein n=1 Tax=Lecanicillium saksenae TaxID=468837 RepID=A0ACC1R6Y6_9HYPO|nr:hypothetical protein NLG97_g987 [Lecanicillium saksenae]